MPGKQPLIAVVNDDTTFLKLMHDLLTGEGYNVTYHSESGNAFGILRREKPDLVILDIRMEHPEAGWLVLDLLRLDPETTDIPVIVCSADVRQLRDKSERLRELRCDTLEKPFDLDLLLEKVCAAVGPPPAVAT